MEILSTRDESQVLELAACLCVALHITPQVQRITQISGHIGSAIHISPNVNSVLLRLGIDVTKVEAVETEMLRAQHQPVEATAKAKDLTASQTPTRRQGFLTYYFSEAAREHVATLVASDADSHNLRKVFLYTALVSMKLSWLLCWRQTSSKVVDIDPDHATLTLGDGEVVQGDVVIAADPYILLRDASAPATLPLRLVWECITILDVAPGSTGGSRLTTQRRRPLSSQYLSRLQGRGGGPVSGLRPACSRIQGDPIKVTRVRRQPKLPT
ncbi:hypothetical protein GB937_004497 [Aspergillus fischeri]|nr:hypothetical protein GB937_004497 [Aspergillus fischeri]